MDSVLILTRNILSDKGLQEKLQYLNYEVLCSSEVLEYVMTQHRYPELLNHFQIIIFSDTVSNAEINRMLPCIEKRGNRLFHKVCDEWEPGEQDEGLIESLTMSTLREQLIQSKFLHVEEENADRLEGGFVEKIKIPDQVELLNLSKLEEKVFYELYHASGKIITRESLCKIIWGKTLTKSHLSHISAIIKKMRLKFKKMNVPDDVIKTVWGEGYMLSPIFFYEEKRIDSSDRQLA